MDSSLNGTINGSLEAGSEELNSRTTPKILNSTFDKGIASNTTLTMNKESPANSPANRTMTRDRQKTMVVESPLIAEIRSAFLSTKQNPDAEHIAELERTVLSCVHRLENDANRRSKDVEQKRTTDLIVSKDMAEESISIAENLISEMESGRVTVGSGECDGNCRTAAKLRLDNEALHSQMEDRYSDYIKLHDVYSKIRKAAALQKEEYNNLEQILQKERSKYEELRGKFARLKESATIQLSKASDDVNRMEREHSEKTIGLRMKVKQLETTLHLKEQEIELKKTELDQLREICDTLMKEVQPQSDVDSERE